MEEQITPGGSPAGTYASPKTCRHCGRAVKYTGGKANGWKTDFTHSNGIIRCLPEESGQPYGIEADVAKES